MGSALFGNAGTFGNYYKSAKCDSEQRVDLFRVCTSMSPDAARSFVFHSSNPRAKLVCYFVSYLEVAGASQTVLNI